MYIFTCLSDHHNRINSWFYSYFACCFFSVSFVLSRSLLSPLLSHTILWLQTLYLCLNLKSWHFLLSFRLIYSIVFLEFYLYVCHRMWNSMWLREPLILSPQILQLNSSILQKTTLPCTLRSQRKYQFDFFYFL